ncbi:ABA4-like family protein [Pseudonocardia sichuanensis]
MTAVDPQLLFSLTFPVAAPFWALMILAPRWTVTRRVVGSPLIVVPPLLGYAALVLPDLAGFLAAVSSPQLAGVAVLLGTPVGAAAGWAHFIAFDLFVGRWIHLDARERGIHPLVTAPVLVLTILLAPLGLLAHLALRTLLPSRREVAQPA